jgi:uncharacterized membrane protein
MFYLYSFNELNERDGQERNTGYRREALTKNRQQHNAEEAALLGTFVAYSAASTQQHDLESHVIVLSGCGTVPNFVDDMEHIFYENEKMLSQGEKSFLRHNTSMTTPLIDDYSEEYSEHSSFITDETGDSESASFEVQEVETQARTTLSERITNFNNSAKNFVKSKFQYVYVFIMLSRATLSELITNFNEGKKGFIESKFQYVYVFVMLYYVPVWAALFLPSSAITMLYFLGFAAIAFVNAWMVCECVASIYYTNKQRELHRSKPQLIGEYRLGAIIAAYLPNELTVLVDTVKAVSAQIHCLPETTTLDIVLAHNGGTPEQRIALLEDLRKIEPDIPLRVNLHELYVVSSKSKAENVNAAISFFQQFEADRLHDFTHVAMYDADHQPIPEAYLYALETLQDQQADMVMGRCCVRDG